MELSPDSAASNAFHAAALIRIVAEKPKKEDYSDYKAFRRAYKAWHGCWTRCHQEVHDPAKREAEREREWRRLQERRARPPEPAQPGFKRPRGRAPLAEGKPCTWNGEDGFWVTANGCHDVAAARKASKAEDFQHLQRIDKEEQKQRRSLCARIAAAVEASGTRSGSLRRSSGRRRANTTM